MPLSYESKYGIMFMRKSHMVCIINYDQIKVLQDYRDALDHLMQGMNARKQGSRQRLMDESKRVTKFLNEFEM